MDKGFLYGLRRRFWLYVHDRLEDAWHWVYYHKLAPPEKTFDPGHVQYRFTYICGRTGMMTDVSPVAKPSTENKQEG